MLDVQQYASAWDKAASLVLEPNPALKLILQKRREKQKKIIKNPVILTCRIEAFGEDGSKKKGYQQ